MNKEQLIEESARLKRDNDVLRTRDEESRKAFALAFGWFKKKGQYDYGESEIRVPTWTEIYVELGKLLERQKRLDYIFQNESNQMQIQELKVDLEDLKQRTIEGMTGIIK